MQRKQQVFTFYLCMKSVVGHEYKSILAIAQCNIYQLHGMKQIYVETELIFQVPLVAVISFLGFRVLASSVLPLSDDTLRESAI